MQNELIKIEYEITNQLAKEIDAIQKNCAEIKDNELTANYPTVDLYTSDYFQTFWGLELKERFKKQSGLKKILDVGVGRGESTIFLANQGYLVSCIEPSYSACKIIQLLSNKFDLSVNIYQCSAEHLNMIPERNFDICIFNNSLHHCDDPYKALRNCYEVLRPGGSVFLMNEIFLRRYKSKKNFYKFMTADPVKSGNYGGNEHAYYYYEYKEILQRSGFLEIKEHIPFRYDHPGLVISNLKTILSKRYNMFDLFIRKVYFRLLHMILKSNFLKKVVLPLLTYMAFVQITFEGKKKYDYL